MPKRSQKLTENKGLIHKIAVIGKDYYTIARIGDLFIFAGADPSWQKHSDDDEDFPGSSMRMGSVYSWVEGLKDNAPDMADKIIEGVALQMIDADIDDGDRNYLLREIGGSPSINRETLSARVTIPDDVGKLLEYIIKSLPRAMFPLRHRRRGSASVDFENEYDVQDLLHALLRPWIKDIRAEEYTPSYAGSSTRIDFLLPEYKIVIEVKYIRDSSHGRKIGQELIVDIAHYRLHPQCEQLWTVIYDPNDYIPNPGGIIADLEKHSEKISVRTFVVG